MRKLGLDLGSKTCGIAISSETNSMVSGLCNFEYKNNDLMQVVNKVKQIYQDYMEQIDTIVIGYPEDHVNQTLNPSCERSQKLKKLLENTLKDVSIVFQDENFTTRRATELLMNSEIKASQRKKVIDMVSSQIILEDYLSKLNK